MNKKIEIIKEGIVVTITSLVAMGISYMIYFLLFRFFRIITYQDTIHRFIPFMRVFYGFFWIVLCLIIYRTNIYDWLKASILTGSLSTFMIGLGVYLYEKPIIIGLELFLVTAAAVILLHKMKRRWYHYYAVGISIFAALIYL